MFFNFFFVIAEKKPCLTAQVYSPHGGSAERLWDHNTGLMIMGPAIVKATFSLIDPLWINVHTVGLKIKPKFNPNALWGFQGGYIIY